MGCVVVAAATGLLLVLARRRRCAVYGAWAFALTVLVLDDSLQWHEAGGAWLDRSVALPDPPGLRPSDVGELLTWAVLGTTVLLVLWLASRRSRGPVRRDSWCLAWLVLFLMVFAVGVDMVHVAIPAVTSSAAVERLVSWTEAAGELAGMAGLLAYAVHIARRERTDRRSTSPTRPLVDPWPTPQPNPSEPGSGRARITR